MPEGWMDESFFARDIAPAESAATEAGSQPGMSLP